MMEMHDNFNERFRKLVECTGMSFHELSLTIGMSQATLISYSRNSKPDFCNLLTLADYFAVPLDYLAGRCTLEQANEILENYPSAFMALRRAPYEAYLSGRKPVNVDIGEAEEPWPYNLMGKVFCEKWGEVISEDQISGINSALDELTEREKDSVLRILRDGMTLKKTGAEHGVTVERERQILGKALRKLRAPHRAALMRYGKEGCEERNRLTQSRKELEREYAEISELKSKILSEKEEIGDLISRKGIIPDTEKNPEMNLEQMDLSVRSYNCLYRHGCKTLQDVVDLAENRELMNVRNLGRKSAEEILSRIYEITHRWYSI